MDKDFKTFLEVWNKPNYERTKEEQTFCLEFKRQMTPTMVQIIKRDNGVKDYQDALEKISQIPYSNRIKSVWEVLYKSE